MHIETTTAVQVTDDYYSKRRTVNGESLSVYQIWERGEAFNDSITPSTYCREYQSHIRLKIERLTGTNDRIFSIGCGNATIEGALTSTGRSVSAIDCNLEAVALAISKGVAATHGDFLQMPAGGLSSFDLVYADGLVGHLCNATSGLAPFLAGVERARLRTTAKLLISNDAPRTRGAALEPHSSVSGFWLVAHDHLAHRLREIGFDILETYTFPYHRPQSGLRDRSICIAERA
jgi:hypothetical protein